MSPNCVLFTLGQQSYFARDLRDTESPAARSGIDILNR